MCLYNGLYEATKNIAVIVSKLLKNTNECNISTLILGLHFLVNYSFDDLTCFKELIIPFISSSTSPKSAERQYLLNLIIELAEKKEEFVTNFIMSKPQILIYFVRYCIYFGRAFDSRKRLY